MPQLANSNMNTARARAARTAIAATIAFAGGVIIMANQFAPCVRPAPQHPPIWLAKQNSKKEHGRNTAALSLSSSYIYDIMRYLWLWHYNIAWRGIRKLLHHLSMCVSGTLFNLSYDCSGPLSLLKCIGTWPRVAGTEVLQTVARVAFWRAREILKIIHTTRVTWGLIGTQKERLINIDELSETNHFVSVSEPVFGSKNPQQEDLRQNYDTCIPNLCASLSPNLSLSLSVCLA